jgi:hypothetical protein
MHTPGSAGPSDARAVSGGAGMGGDAGLSEGRDRDVQHCGAGARVGGCEGARRGGTGGARVGSGAGRGGGRAGSDRVRAGAGRGACPAPPDIQLCLEVRSGSSRRGAISSHDVT